ncbi:hypothetical protein CDAR_545161 [Caerostris darwini]|uniref:Uncharacterized protein n=1 Tax=Caerostris darwini TaxID=1538125 RepID=A0AAV4THG4_9ARAC|nr:hypothetical protein CDAR_545161 [Caerostris darwini]
MYFAVGRNRLLNNRNTVPALGTTHVTSPDTASELLSMSETSDKRNLRNTHRMSNKSPVLMDEKDELARLCKTDSFKGCLSFLEKVKIKERISRKVIVGIFYVLEKKRTCSFL